MNQVTIPNHFSIPTIEELINELHIICLFLKLDLQSGYHQIRMANEDINKTTFMTHEGYYEFPIMPFGLMNTSTTFAMMNLIMKPI